MKNTILWFTASVIFAMFFFWFISAKHGQLQDQSTFKQIVQWPVDEPNNENTEEIITWPKSVSNKRIAHAGWGFKWEAYTNSLDALEANKDLYEFFEIDLSWTSDNKLVCIHDWEWSPITNLWTVYREEPLSLAEFTALVDKNEKYKNCTISQLIDWLKDNPRKFLVLDIKDRNIEALARIYNTYPEVQDRIIAQMYSPRDYKSLEEMWYKNIIWALYKYTGNTQEVLWNAQYYDLFAVSLNDVRMKTDLPFKLKDAGIYVYTHTINDRGDLTRALNLWADEIMTDFLP